MVRWKCLLCGRKKFTSRQAHRCNKNFRKRRIKWERIDEDMATIAAAGNAETACFQVLLDKGYKLKSLGVNHEALTCTFRAEKDGNSFSAESGIELLGLVALWETYGSHWQDEGLIGNTWEQIERMPL